MKRSELMFVAASVLVALGGCGSSSNNNNDAGTGVTCTDMTSSANPTVGIVTRTGGVYGTGVTYVFSPQCIQINRTQSVTFTGNYSAHNLTRTTQTVATAANPLPSTPYTGTSPVTFGPFPDAGDFGFECTIHGFFGTVRVNP